MERERYKDDEGGAYKRGGSDELSSLSKGFFFHRLLALVLCLMASSIAEPSVEATLEQCSFAIENLYVGEDKAAVSKQLAAYVAAASESSIKERGTFTVAISGGSLPAILAAGLLDLDGVDYDKVRVRWMYQVATRVCGWMDGWRCVCGVCVCVCV